MNGEDMGNGISVLVLDSDAASREELVNELLMAGFERVEVADSDDEATRKLGEDRFDAVLVEIRWTAAAVDFVKRASALQKELAIVLVLDDHQRGGGYSVPAVMKSAVSAKLEEVIKRRKLRLASMEFDRNY